MLWINLQVLFISRFWIPEGPEFTWILQSYFQATITNIQFEEL